MFVKTFLFLKHRAASIVSSCFHLLFSLTLTPPATKAWVVSFMPCLAAALGSCGVVVLSSPLTHWRLSLWWEDDGCAQAQSPGHLAGGIVAWLFMSAWSQWSHWHYRDLPSWWLHWPSHFSQCHMNTFLTSLLHCQYIVNLKLFACQHEFKELYDGTFHAAIKS